VDAGGGVFVVNQDGAGVDAFDIAGGASNSVQPLHDANNSKSARQRFIGFPPWLG
jgi:hypothetical protein